MIVLNCFAADESQIYVHMLTGGHFTLSHCSVDGVTVRQPSIVVDALCDYHLVRTTR